jgi:hypothetical protein
MFCVLFLLCVCCVVLVVYVLCVWCTLFVEYMRVCVYACALKKGGTVLRRSQKVASRAVNIKVSGE